MVSNKECTDEFNKFLRSRDQYLVGPSEFKRALRELGFVRPTSRKKMKILTWKEIEDKSGKKDRPRLANIYTGKVLGRIGLTTKMPDFKKSVGDVLIRLKDIEEFNTNEDFFERAVGFGLTEDSAKQLLEDQKRTGQIAMDPSTGHWKWIQ